jgi:hypothetical protein
MKWDEMMCAGMGWGECDITDSRLPLFVDVGKRRVSLILYFDHPTTEQLVHIR